MSKQFGTEADPVIILDDEELQRKRFEKVQIEANRLALEEAKLTGKVFQICRALVKTKIKGNVKQKDERLKEEIIRYYQDRLNVNLREDYFNPKIEVDYSEEVQLSPKQFILYGVDFLSTELIRQRFNTNKLEINEIKWINDSTCLLDYNTKEEAHMFLQENIEDSNQFMESEENSQVSKNWFSLKPYEIYGIKRNLSVRYATTKEYCLPKEEIVRYIQFQQARNEIQNYLLNKFGVIQQFKGILSEMEYEKQRRRRFNNRTQDRNRFHRRDKFNNSEFGQNRRQFRNIYDQNENGYRRSRHQPYYDNYHRSNRDPSNERERSRDLRHLRPNNQNQSFTNQNLDLSIAQINQHSKNDFNNLSFSLEPKECSNKDLSLDFDHENIGQNNGNGDLSILVAETDKNNFQANENLNISLVEEGSGKQRLKDEQNILDFIIAENCENRNEEKQIELEEFILSDKKGRKGVKFNHKDYRKKEKKIQPMNLDNEENSY